MTDPYWFLRYSIWDYLPVLCFRKTLRSLQWQRDIARLYIESTLDDLEQGGEINIARSRLYTALYSLDTP